MYKYMHIYIYIYDWCLSIGPLIRMPFLDR